jgi:hypothetical protein
VGDIISILTYERAVFLLTREAVKSTSEEGQVLLGEEPALEITSEKMIKCNELNWKRNVLKRSHI